jgi:lipopolysaccharide export system protein LptA
MILYFSFFILLLAITSYGGILHIVAGETNYEIGGTLTTILDGKIIIGDTTIIASNIIVSGEKDANGNVTWKSADATGNVIVILKDATVTANRMHYNLKQDNGTLTGNASMTISASTSNISIQSSTLSFDTKNDVYTGSGSPVIIQKGKIHIEGKNFVYEAKKKIFSVFKDVYLFNSSSNEKAWAEELEMNIEKNSMILKKVKMEITLK